MRTEDIPEIQASEPKMGNERKTKEIPVIQEDLVEKGEFIGRFAIIVPRASQRVARIPFGYNLRYKFNLFLPRNKHVTERR